MPLLFITLAAAEQMLPSGAGGARGAESRIDPRSTMKLYCEAERIMWTKFNVKTNVQGRVHHVVAPPPKKI